MKAAVIAENGLEIRDIAKPAPKPNEVLVQVRACGLNRADLLMAAGRFHGSSDGVVAGLEWSGEVVETGAEVTDVKPGDRVMCSGSGGYAEYAVSDRGASIRIPVGTIQNGWKGYLEDRRPASNADPYKVVNEILKTLRS